MLLNVLHHKGLGEPYSKAEKVLWPHYTSLELGLLLRDWHFFIFYYDPLTSQASSLQLVWNVWNALNQTVYFRANESPKKHEGTAALNNKYCLLISWHLGCGVTFSSVAPLRSSGNVNENLDAHEPFVSHGPIILFYCNESVATAGE